MPDSQRFTLGFRLIHWAMALILLTMLIFGQRFGTDLPEAERIFSLTGHSSLGALIIILLTLRILARLSGLSGRPQHDLPAWQGLASKSVQAALYLLMIYLPVTGILTARAHALPVEPFGLFSISTPNQTAYEALRPWHDYGTKALMILLAAHIGAALFHRFIQRDEVMAAMSLFKPRS